MRRKLLLVLAVAAATALGNGAKPAVAAATDPMPTARSSMTVVGIDISTGASQATDITGGVSWLNACVQNVSTSSILACGDSINVSTVTLVGTANTGTILPAAAAAAQPATPVCFAFNWNQRWYCQSGPLSGNANVASHAVVIKSR